MDKLIKEYSSFVNDQITSYKNEEQLLQDNDRKDESNFFKIRGNVCDIFLTLMNATIKAVEAKHLEEKEMKELFISEYLKKFETIPMNWKGRLEQGKRVGDSEIIAIEEAKFDTMNLLKENFLKLINI